MDRSRLGPLSLNSVKSTWMIYHGTKSQLCGGSCRTNSPVARDCSSPSAWVSVYNAATLEICHLNTEWEEVVKDKLRDCSNSSYYMCTDVCLTDQRTPEAYSGGGYPVGRRSWPNRSALHDLLRYYEDVLSIDHHGYHPALTVD